MTMPVDHLRANLADIDRMLRHFARVQREHVPALRAFLQTALRASEGRARAAVETSRRRSERIAAGIRLAVGALPRGRSVRELTGILRQRIGCNPERYGLKSVPCDRVLRRVLRKVNGLSVPKVPHEGD